MPQVTAGTPARDANHPTRPPVPAQWGSVPCFWELTAWGEHSQGQQSCYRSPIHLRPPWSQTFLPSADNCVCMQHVYRQAVTFGDTSMHPRGLKRDMQYQRPVIAMY